MDERVIFTVRGNVQDTGLLWWAERNARSLGLVGHACNRRYTEVEILVQGQADAIETFYRRLLETPTTTWRPGTILDHTVEIAELQVGLLRFTAA